MRIKNCSFSQLDGMLMSSQVLTSGGIITNRQLTLFYYNDLSEISEEEPIAVFPAVKHAFL